MRQPSPRWEAPNTRAMSRPTDGFSATITMFIRPSIPQNAPLRKRRFRMLTKWADCRALRKPASKEIFPLEKFVAEGDWI